MNTIENNTADNQPPRQCFFRPDEVCTCFTSLTPEVVAGLEKDIEQLVILSDELAGQNDLSTSLPKEMERGGNTCVALLSQLPSSGQLVSYGMLYLRLVEQLQPICSHPFFGDEL